MNIIKQTVHRHGVGSVGEAHPEVNLALPDPLPPGGVLPQRNMKFQNAFQMHSQMHFKYHVLGNLGAKKLERLKTLAPKTLAPKALAPKTFGAENLGANNFGAGAELHHTHSTERFVKHFYFFRSRKRKKVFAFKTRFRAKHFFWNQLFGLLPGRPDLNQKKCWTKKVFLNQKRLSEWKDFFIAESWFEWKKNLKEEKEFWIKKDFWFTHRAPLSVTLLDHDFT